MGNVISEEEIDQTYSLLPSGEYANTSSQNRHSYNSDQQWNEDAREVERLVRVGNNFCKHGHYERALKYYEEALEVEIHRLGLSENHMSVAITHNNMGIVLNKLGRYEESMEKYWESLRIKKMKLMKDHVNIAGTLHNMGVVHRNKKEYDLAMACYEEALRIRTMRLGRRSAHCAATLQNMGIVHRERGEYSRALLFLEEALDINQLVIGSDSIDVANVLNDIGKIHACKDEYDQAIQYYDEASFLLHKAKLSTDHIYIRENKIFMKEAKKAIGEEIESSDEEKNEDIHEENDANEDVADEEASFGEFTKSRFSESIIAEPATTNDLLDFDSNVPTASTDEEVLIDFLTPSIQNKVNNESIINIDEPFLSFDSDNESNIIPQNNNVNSSATSVTFDISSSPPPLFPSMPKDSEIASSTHEVDDDIQSSENQIVDDLLKPVEIPVAPSFPPPIPSTNDNGITTPLTESKVSTSIDINVESIALNAESIDNSSLETKESDKAKSINKTANSTGNENGVKENLVKETSKTVTENSSEDLVLEGNDNDQLLLTTAVSSNVEHTVLTTPTEQPEQSSAILWGYD